MFCGLRVMSWPFTFPINITVWYAKNRKAVTIIISPQVWVPLPLTTPLFHLQWVVPPAKWWARILQQPTLVMTPYRSIRYSSWYRSLLKQVTLYLCSYTHIHAAPMGKKRFHVPLRKKLSSYSLKSESSTVSLKVHKSKSICLYCCCFFSK